MNLYHLMLIVFVAATQAAEMEALPQVNPISPRPRNDNLFDDGVVFISFLKALIENYADDLAQMNNPNEIQALSDHPEIRKYKDIILNKHFAVRWKTLYAKCAMDDTQPHLKTMLEKARIINDAMNSHGDLSAFFSEFRFLPCRQEKNDMQSASLRKSGEKGSADLTSSSESELVCKRPRLVPERYISPKFESFAEFTKFLEVLVRECSHELSQFETTDDLKKLVDHPAMEPFKGILNHEDFVLRWNELHDKCDFIQKADRRMDTNVKEIQTLLKNPKSLHYFADFPVKPNGNIEDTMRYIAQLRTVMDTGKFAHLNKKQMRHVKFCLNCAKKKLQTLKRLHCTI